MFRRILVALVAVVALSIAATRQQADELAVQDHGG